MQIIPVLDLMGGVVVRGVMGDRANYRPIESRIAPSPDPVAVALALRDLGGFTSFYIADLDAIEGRGAHDAAIDALAISMPDAEFWIDAGPRRLGDVTALLARPFVSAVIGSETIDTIATVEAFASERRAILSLDYRGDDFVGPDGLDAAPSLWPARVIAMTLAKVGSGAGPDFERLARIRALAETAASWDLPKRCVYAAGGVRHLGDLAALQEAGIAGVLVASALHDGRLDAAAIATFHD